VASTKRNTYLTIFYSSSSCDWLLIYTWDCTDPSKPIILRSWYARETYCTSHGAAFCDRLIRRTLPTELWRDSAMTSGNGIWSAALTRASEFNHVTCAQNFRLTPPESYCGEAAGKCSGRANLHSRRWMWGSNPWSIELLAQSCALTINLCCNQQTWRQCVHGAVRRRAALHSQSFVSTLHCVRQILS
jgi:hypothetical protein